MSPHDVEGYLRIVNVLPWYRRLPVKAALKMAPNDIFAANQQSFPRKARGLLFLVFGFAFQAVGAFGVTLKEVLEMVGF